MSVDTAAAQASFRSKYGHIVEVSCPIWKTSSPTTLPVLLAHGLATCSLPSPPMTGHFLVSHTTKALSAPTHRSSGMTTDTPEGTRSCADHLPTGVANAASTRGSQEVSPNHFLFSEH